MPLPLAARMSAVKVSPTAAAMARAQAAKARGRPVISLTTGEPDFDTPRHIQEAAITAMRGGQTRYTAVDGTPDIKRAVIGKFRRENGLDFAPEEVIVSTGAKQVIYNALMALVEPGCDVIVPNPAWVSYPDMARLAGGTPVEARCLPADGFRLQPETLSGLLSPRTRVLMLNSPSNPTGAVLTADALRDIGEILRAWPGVVTICDDIYEHIRFDTGTFATLAQVCPDLRDRILTVNGVSKAYAMTGWRLGYGAGPADLIRAMRVVQSQSTSNPCSVSQAAAVAALEGGLQTVEEQRQAFAQRRDYLLKRFAGIEGLSVVPGDGAFYLFVGIEGWIGATLPDGTEITSEADFVDALLDRHDVAVVGGAGFGLSPYFRLSFAASDADLAEAMDRLESFLSELRKPGA